MHIPLKKIRTGIIFSIISPLLFCQNYQCYRSVNYGENIIYFDEIKIKNNVYSLWERREGIAQQVHFNKKSKTISFDGKIFEPIAPESNAEFIFSSLDTFITMKNMKIPIFKKQLNPSDTNHTRIYIDSIKWFTPGFAYVRPNHPPKAQKLSSKIEFWLIHWEQKADGDFHDLILNSYDQASNLIATVAVFRTKFDKVRFEDVIINWGVIPKNERVYEPIKPESVFELAINEITGRK